jgi:hypothetical protein
MSVYLGVEAGRHDLVTWDDLVRAVEGGLLNENHWVELKKSIPNVPRSNEELARDLASLAVDGGTLIVGVQEKDSHAEKVIGVELKGVQERIEQAAESHIHPRLYFRVRPIRHPGDPDLACVVVEIPASGQAPHQVDFVYYGRSEMRKDRLADDRVREIMASRSASLRRTGGKLTALAARFPMDLTQRRCGHLFVITDPIDADPDVLTELLDRADHQTLGTAADRAAATMHQNLRSFRPVLLAGTQGWRTRTAGLALTSVTGDGIDEKRVLEYLVRRDGGIETTCGSGTRQGRSEWRRPGPPDQMPVLSQVVSCTWMLAVVHSTLAFAAALTQHSHYQGRWQLGVLFDGMLGAAPHETLMTGLVDEEDVDRYDEDRYERLTVTTTAELVDDTPALVERLVGNFLRGLDMQRRFLPYSEWHANGRVTPKPGVQ